MNKIKKIILNIMMLKKAIIKQIHHHKFKTKIKLLGFR
jgi:hypothetical protein